MSQSEVARLRAQIEAEFIAAQRGIDGYASVARHEFIQLKMAQIGAYHEQLKALIGAEEAMRLICEVNETCIQA